MNQRTEAILDFTAIKRELQEYTLTPMGKSLAAQLQPSADATVLDTQLRETSELVMCLSADEGPPFTAIPDIAPHLDATHIEGFYLEGGQLLEVAEVLESVQRLRRYAQNVTLPMPFLLQRLTRLADFGIVLRGIRHAIDEQGQVRDHASPTLHHLRQELKRLRERVHDRLRSLMITHRSVVQDSVVTIRNNRFVIPLKTDFHQVLRGIVHGESASGATMYVEPDSVVDLNNQLLHLHSEEERAVREILRELTKHLAAQRVLLEQALRILADVDLLRAKGRLSLRMQGRAPRLTMQPYLQVFAARHPLLSTPTPIDIHLGPEHRTLVITGPNTGGKTAVLKTVGLFALMAQSGLHIPAGPDSTLPIFSEVFVDVGDEQNLQQSLSTFSAHLANICTVMRQVSAHSLVLLDELGAGTDPMEGGPLGVAILERLHASGALTIVTTHHSIIKTFAMSTPHVACAAVDFDLDTLQPRYQLVYGLPGRSKAFAIARKLGVPAAVLERAEQEAGLTQMRNEELLARLEHQHQTLTHEREQAQVERQEIARLHAEARRLHERARSEEQRIREALYAEGQTVLKTIRQELDATLAAVRRHLPAGQPPVAFPQAAWQRVEQMVASFEPAASAQQRATQPLNIGDRVRVRGLNIIGRLRTSTEGNEQVQVEVGSKTLTVAATALERAEDAESMRGASTASRSVPSPRRDQGETLQVDVPPELRLLGYTVSEAIPVLEKYLDQAFTQGLARVRIVHGIGSGRLRDAVIELLDGHQLVRRFQAGDTRGGMTIVELER
jgi:DNA mismatch repair protein MutS2